MSSQLVIKYAECKITDILILLLKKKKVRKIMKIACKYCYEVCRYRLFSKKHDYISN